MFIIDEKYILKVRVITKILVSARRSNFLEISLKILSNYPDIYYFSPYKYYI